MLPSSADVPGALPPPPSGPSSQGALPPPPSFVGTTDVGTFKRPRGRGRGGGRGQGGRMAMPHDGPFESLSSGMMMEGDRAAPPFIPPVGFGAAPMPFRPDALMGGPMMGLRPPAMWPPLPGGFMPAGRGMLTAGGPRPDRWAATRVIDNDYCQHFVDTGQRPQNHLRDSVAGAEVFQDYPKLKELVEAKRALLELRKTPAYALQADLATLPLNVATFGTRFDVLIIDPPWEEYARRCPEGAGVVTWSWDKIRDLAIPDLLDAQAFVFLWCGNEEAVEAGRHCFTKWGLHRVEDICWVKTNRDLKKRKYLNATHQRPVTTLHHVKEHCLVGRHGDINRKRDAHFVHSNVDVDIILSEEPELGSLQKPEELYDIIERFCLGRRRLELFGMDHNMRDGWVTVGIDISVSNFNKDVYSAHFLKKDGLPYISTSGKVPKDGPHLLGTTDLIESLRPRSP